MSEFEKVVAEQRVGLYACARVPTYLKRRVQGRTGYSWCASRARWARFCLCGPARAGRRYDWGGTV